jgi:hypothetical protein
MKRGGPIRRKTELSRGDGLKPGKPLQRKPIRKRSSKKSKEINDTRDARRLYLEAHPRCCVCGGVAVDVNEIPRGPSRVTAVRDPDAWNTACRSCHDNELGDYSKWPIAKQIARKWLEVLESINQHREGRAQTSPDEVIEHLRELIRTR